MAISSRLTSGVSMIVLAGLVWLPMWVSVVVGAVMVAGHNLLDGVAPASLGAWAPLFQVLHVPGPGALLTRSRPAAERQRLLLGIGLAITIAFVVIRALNRYGEPRPWACVTARWQRSFRFST